MPKEKIHPNYAAVRVVCACGNNFETRSTHKGDIHVEICSVLPPILHRQTEAGRHGRPRRALPPQVREGRRDNGCQVRPLPQDSARASATAGAYACLEETAYSRQLSAFSETARLQGTDKLRAEGSASMPRRGFTVKKAWDNPREHPMPAATRVPAEVSIGPVKVRPATVLAPTWLASPTPCSGALSATPACSPENRDQGTGIGHRKSRQSKLTLATSSRDAGY